MSVRKGEHGTRVYFVSKLEKASDDGEKPNLIPFLKEYVVFNIAQCVGLPEELLTGEARPLNLDERNADAQEFIAITGADIREGGEAYYAAGRDFISMPAFEAFKDADSFYATNFHELGHWTAHKSRLDRDLKNRFGSRDYAAEELVAELASAFLCAEFGINKETRHASYIAHWIELLKHDDRAFLPRHRKRKKSLTTSVASLLKNPQRNCLMKLLTVEIKRKLLANGANRDQDHAPVLILQPGWQRDLADFGNGPRK